MTSEPADRRPLSEDERMEYIQIGDFYKHDDTIAYHLASILLPLSFGAIATAQKFPEIKISLCFFSIAIYAYWILFSERLAWFSKIRMIRARELEDKAGLRHHNLLEEPPAKLKCKLGDFLRIGRIRFIFLFLLVIIWVGLFLLN